MMQAYSAPGKALVAGGYLVLFPEFAAFSIALSSRMHAVAEPLEACKLVVSSPQFASQWSYNLAGGPAGDIDATGPHKNPFLEAVARVLAEYYEAPTGTHITMWSDQGFHTQPAGATERFTMHNTYISDVPKTGLGSSAALTVAVVTAAVRAQTGKNGALDADELRTIHNISQVAHSRAQGKAGSGFDVATAVYGSCLYSTHTVDTVGTIGSQQSTRAVIDREWDVSIEPVKLPEGIKVILGDVAAGSETPSMVRKVLAWRQSNPQRSKQLWDKLNAANMSLVAALQMNDPASIGPSIERIRAQLRAMSAEASVPIEPLSQTVLLDRCTAVDGVFGGVVPGAGGSDAVCVLVEAAKFESALAALSEIPGVKWLQLEQQNDGIRAEPLSSYPTTNGSH